MPSEMSSDFLGTVAKAFSITWPVQCIEMEWKHRAVKVNSNNVPRHGRQNVELLFSHGSIKVSTAVGIHAQPPLATQIQITADLAYHHPNTTKLGQTHT